MIYITGDTHGSQERFEKYDLMYEKGEIKAGDYIIICGDFGYLFKNNEAENKFLDYLEKKPYEILFIDGNHENFKAIYSYPVEAWSGGQTHRIRKNIRHLKRGYVFNIDGKKVFTFGGAYSIDRYIRKKDVSYWDEELPVKEDYIEAVLNLKRNCNKVDLIVTHTCPTEIIRMMRHFPDGHDIELTGFLEYIMHEVDFKFWCFGHWHTEKRITDKIIAVYEHNLKYDGEKIVDLDKE